MVAIAQCPVVLLDTYAQRLSVLRCGGRARQGLVRESSTRITSSPGIVPILLSFEKKLVAPPILAVAS